MEDIEASEFIHVLSSDRPCETELITDLSETVSASIIKVCYGVDP
jgi:hypothetical protein